MKTEIEVASAGVADAAVLSELASKTYRDAYGGGMDPDDLRQHVEAVLSPRRWRDYLATDEVLVARSGSELIGLVQFGPRQDADETEIKRLYVDAPWQGRGVGSRLLKLAIKALEAGGATAIWIDVWHDNARARRLYERFGFAAVGRRPFVLPSGRVDGHDVEMVRRQR